MNWITEKNIILIFLFILVVLDLIVLKSIINSRTHLNKIIFYTLTIFLILFLLGLSYIFLFILFIGMNS